jgi:flagellar biosynthesis/type III secretory pathway protein FliH
MLIKRQKIAASEGLSKSMEQSTAIVADENALSVPTEPEWSPEHVKTGLAPERRIDRTGSERRRSYRRIEDRDLISQAHEEALAIKEHAQSLGFQEGLDQAQASINELHDFLKTQLSLREQALASVAGEIAELAVEVAARIIKTEVSCDETLVMSLVRDTIQKSSQGQRSNKANKRLLIKVHPDDVAIVKQFLKEEASSGDFQGSELLVVGEPTVEAGSCTLETDSGMIDASFGTQLDILYRLFRGTSSQAGSV